MFARSLGIYRYAAAPGTTNHTWIGLSEKEDENYFNNEFAINGMVERVVLFFLLYARNFLTYVERERGKGRDRDR